MRLVSGSFAFILLVCPFAKTQAANLDSYPPGAYVRVSGRVGLAGVTPLPLDDLPPGTYRIEAKGRGTALARGRLVREAGAFGVMPSVSATAMLLPPGILHMQQNETGRGLLFLGAGLSGGTMAVINEVSRSDAEEDVDRAQQRYDDAVAEEDIVAARLDLGSAQDEADDEAEMRNLWAIYGGATWVGAAVEQWLLTPHATLDATSSALRIPRAGGPRAGLLSALVPGAGQRYIGRSSRGNLFTMGVMGLSAVTLVAHESYLDARRDQAEAQRHYDAASTEDELDRWQGELEDTADTADSKNTLQWACAAVTAGVYLWNVFDAWFVGERAGSERPLDMSVLPAPDGVQATLTWRMH
ncbi:MAG TPA: hypothetical protein VFP10_12630 [Candidatus Eisenbacteria bacterium]|nr:hypothetical protein [Candidatus Eisenbacteria bacterium]